jgi:hypothetical protein
MPKFSKEVKIDPIDFVDACDEQDMRELKAYLAELEPKLSEQDEALYIALHKIGEARGRLTLPQIHFIHNLAATL